MCRRVDSSDRVTWISSIIQLGISIVQQISEAMNLKELLIAAGLLVFVLYFWKYWVVGRSIFMAEKTARH